MAIFPKFCLWRRSLCSNLGGIGPENLYRATLSTLGARDFSSGSFRFVSSLYSDPPVFSRDFAARSLGLQWRAEDMSAFIRPTPKIPAARETKPLVPRVRIKMNSTNWPAPNNVWIFIAQFVEHCSANAKTMGSNTVEFPTFSPVNLQLLKMRFPLRRSYLHRKLQPPWSTTKNRTKNQSISSFPITTCAATNIPTKTVFNLLFGRTRILLQQTETEMKYQLQIDDAFPSIYLWGKTVINLWQKTPLKPCFKKGIRPVSLQGPVCIMAQVSEIMEILDGDQVPSMLVSSL